MRYNETGHEEPNAYGVDERSIRRKLYILHRVFIYGSRALSNPPSDRSASPREALGFSVLARSAVVMNDLWVRNVIFFLTERLTLGAPINSLTNFMEIRCDSRSTWSGILISYPRYRGMPGTLH